MHTRIHYLFRLAFFWLIYFTLFRLVFIAWHYDKLPDGYLSNTFLALFKGYRLDISMTCYLITVPFLLWIIQQFARHRVIHRINHIYNILIIFIIALISIGNIRMFTEWGTLLNARALAYLRYPGEVMHYASTMSIILGLAAWILSAMLGVLLYRIIAFNFSYPVENIRFRLVQVVIFSVLLITGIRGGWQLAPVNESAAYYSSYAINNKIAINSPWYLMHSIAEASAQKNPFAVMDSKKAELRVKNLLASRDSLSDHLLNTPRPNIVFIILESWTADILDEPQTTPHFHELEKEGLLFTQAYGSGYRTDQGLAAIISGFPAQPNNSIITTPSKSEKLPSIVNEFKKDGYATSFYYGGEAEFANMKMYLLNSGFDKLVDKSSFSKDQFNSKWGAHDEYVLSRQADELKSEKQPFFSAVLTLSTHEPFEVPIRTPFTGDDLPSKFRSAAYYTDQCLGDYFNRARIAGWFDNTLFVLVADHGHHLPKEIDLYYPSAHRITMMLYGGALKEEYRGKKIDKTVEQTAISSTLLAQLGKDHSTFGWSRNIFAKDYKEFAYYSMENELGWVTPQQQIMHTYVPARTETGSKTAAAVADSLLTDGQAYLQWMYEQYLSY
jgi:phosphoglycerol transferase MdoB-like AlkP superfamily enzyme